MKTNLEKNIKQIASASSGLLVIGLFLLSSCTKEIPFKSVDPGAKEHVISKSLVHLDKEYLYSASMQNASRSSSDALPFSTGDNKRVKLEISETSLRIMETERDARYSANSANSKLILEVPIEHTQFQCAQDRYGECKNEEENATSVPWEQRNGIKVKLEDAKSGELDMLPIMNSKTFGDDCFDTVSTVLKSSNITDDSINFQVERTFKTKLECLASADTLSDATVTAVYHYSLVRLDTVLSSDFQTISYPESSADEQKFGFFSTKRVILDVDNNKTTTSKVQIMNHWNPNRTELPYYLSDEFAKPENKMIKDLTYTTIDNLNQGLAEAGVNFQIKLHDPENKVPGDIRNSMIVLVEDPVESNVIGYGPQTEDPVTGEIISARTVMFLGTIKKFIKYTYDDILRAKNFARVQAAANSSKGVDPNSVVHLGKGLQAKTEAKKSSGRMAGISAVETKLAQGSVASKGFIASVKNASANDIISTAGKIQQIQASLKNYTSTVNPEIVGTDLKSQLRYLNEAKNCAYTPVMESFAGGISDELMSQFPDNAKPWNDLSADEKNDVIKIILPKIWIPTLIHELGHNLGLRHNFAASEDKDNFLSPDELKAKHIDHAIPFSSVMDYGDDLRTLPVLGKYDIAALRFGYLRTVQVDNGDGTLSQKQVNTTLQDLMSADSKLKIKDYMYCTDEHLGINAGCKQFDLGTSYTEIVQNFIKDYETGYSKRNLRDNRENMSLMDDLKYASRIGGIFRELRVMMEVRERVKYANGLPDNAPEWESIPFLKDLNQASLISGAFLSKVLLVPDVICGVAKVDAPTEIVGLLPIKNLDPEAISCFSARINPAYKVVAQTGKMFNSKKDPASTNPYADQIDVRGVWLDKLMAAKYLFNRQIGTYTMDKYVDNFLDIPALRAPILDVVHGIMTNSVVDTVPFTMADGSTKDIEIDYDLFDSQLIDQTIDPRIGQRLGIHPDRATQLQEVISSKIANQLVDKTGAHEQDKSIANSMVVLQVDPSSQFSSEVHSLAIGDSKYLANASNTLAIEMMGNYSIASALETLQQQVSDAKVNEVLQAKIAKKDAPVAATKEELAAYAMSVEDIQAYVDGTKGSDVLDALGKSASIAKVKEILAAKDAKTPAPITASPEEQAVYQISSENIIAFYSGAIKSSDFYPKILNLLPNSTQ